MALKSFFSDEFLDFNSCLVHKGASEYVQKIKFLGHSLKEEFFEAHVKPLWITFCDIYASSSSATTSIDLEIKFTEIEKKYISSKFTKMRSYISKKNQDKSLCPVLKSTLQIDHADDKLIGDDNFSYEFYLSDWSGETLMQLLLMPQSEIKRKANAFVSATNDEGKECDVKSAVFLDDNEKEDNIDNDGGHKKESDSRRMDLKTILNQKNIDVIVKKLLATKHLLGIMDTIFREIDNFDNGIKNDGFTLDNDIDKYLNFHKKLSLSKIMISGMNKAVLDWLFIKLFIPFAAKYYYTVSLFPDKINDKEGTNDGIFSILILKVITFFSTAPSCLSTIPPQINNNNKKNNDYTAFFEGDSENDDDHNGIDDNDTKHFAFFNFDVIDLFKESDYENGNKLELLCNNIFIEKIHMSFFHLFYKKYLKTLIKKYNIDSDANVNVHENKITVNDVNKIHFAFSLGQMLSVIKKLSYGLLKLPYDFKLNPVNNNEFDVDNNKEAEDKEEEYEIFFSKIDNNYNYFVNDLKKKSFCSINLVILEKYIRTFVNEYYSYLFSHSSKLINVDDNNAIKQLLLFENPLLAMVDSNGKFISYNNDNNNLNSDRFCFLFNAIFEYLKTYPDIMYSQLSADKKDEGEAKKVMLELFSGTFIGGVCESIVENLIVNSNIEVIFEEGNKSINKGIIAVVYKPTYYHLSNNGTNMAYIPTAAVNIIGTISSAIYYGVELVKASKFSLKDLYKTKVSEFLRRLRFIKILDNNNFNNNKIIDLSLLTSEAIQTIILFGTDSFNSFQRNNKNDNLFSFIALFMSFCVYNCNLNIGYYCNSYIDNNVNKDGYVYSNSCTDLMIIIFSFLYQYNLLKFYDDNDNNRKVLSRQRRFLDLIKEYISNIVSNGSSSDVSLLRKVETSKNENEIIDFFLRKSTIYSSNNNELYNSDNKILSSNLSLSEISGRSFIDEVIIEALFYSWIKINNNSVNEIFDFENKNIIYFLIDRFDKDIKKSREFFGNFAKDNNKVNVITLPSWNWKFFFSIDNNNYNFFSDDISNSFSSFFTLYLPEVSKTCDSFSQWWQLKKDSSNKNKNGDKSISFITDINKSEFCSIIFKLNLISNNNDNKFTINTNLIMIPAILQFINKKGGKCSMKELMDECNNSFIFLKIVLDAIYDNTLTAIKDEKEKEVNLKEGMNVSDINNGQSLLNFFEDKNAENENNKLIDVSINYNYKSDNRNIDIIVSRNHIFKKYKEYRCRMSELNSMDTNQKEGFENLNVPRERDNYTKNILTSRILKLLKKSPSSFDDISSYCTDNKDNIKDTHLNNITVDSVKAVIEELVSKEYIERDGEVFTFIPS